MRAGSLKQQHQERAGPQTQAQSASLRSITHPLHTHNLPNNWWKEVMLQWLEPVQEHSRTFYMF